LKNTANFGDIIEFQVIGYYEYDNCNVFDARGNLLKTLPINKQSGEIDLSNFSSGMYILNFESAEGFVTSKKLIIAK
jgi:hypothetical protein